MAGEPLVLHDNQADRATTGYAPGVKTFVYPGVTNRIPAHAGALQAIAGDGAYEQPTCHRLWTIKEVPPDLVNAPPDVALKELVWR